MGNIALEKKILEDYWTRPEELTNGNYSLYDGKKGYTYTKWPNYLTVDLLDKYEIETIRFLLYDEDKRIYKYRLLTSIDYKTWTVCFDSHNNGYNGWQEFSFPNKIFVRYIRIHCLWNSINHNFHIIELQVFDKETFDLDVKVSNKRIIIENELEKEVGVKLPLTEEIKILTKSLESIFINQPLINSKPAQEIISKLETQAIDIEKLELSIDSIRREIINPVKIELNKGRKFGLFSILGFWVGLAGIIISIFAILNGIFDWI